MRGKTAEYLGILWLGDVIQSRESNPKMSCLR